MLKAWRMAKLVPYTFVGVMGMATNTDNTTQVEKEFKSLKDFFDEVKKELFQS
jgi:uncharacterized pyridoxal phosphate-containing UPF0001 family protein